MSSQILILGTPRSGTTWVFEVLAGAPGVTPVLEPDNEKVSFLGRWYKSHLPRFPTLQPGDEDSVYLALWNQAMYSPLGSWLATNRFLRTLEGLVFDGEKLVEKKERQAFERFGQTCQSITMRPPNGPFNEPIKRSSDKFRVVKSVHGVFAAEWIAHKTRPDHTLIVQRMPHGIIASMKKLAMGDAWRYGSVMPLLSEDEWAPLRGLLAKNSPAFAASAKLFRTDLTAQERIALTKEWESQTKVKEAFAIQTLTQSAVQLAKMYAWLDELLRRHPEWTSVKHETLCEDPVARYRELFERIEMPWSAKIEAGIRERDRPGDGFAAVRKASDQVGKWKKSLSTDEIDLIDRIFAERGLEHWTSSDRVASK